MKICTQNNFSDICLLTSRSTDGSSVACVGDDEEGLDEGTQGIHNVSEYLSGVLLHIIRLTE